MDSASATASVIALVAALAGLSITVAYGRRALRSGTWTALTCLLIVSAFRHLSHSLQSLGITPALADASDYLEVLLPMLWLMVFYLSARDIAHQDLAEREERYRVLLSSLPQRVFFKDRQSRFVSVNARFAQDLGLQLEDIIGKTDWDLYPPELAQKYQADDERIMRTGMPETIVEKNVTGGLERIVEVTKAPVRSDKGTVLGVLGIFTDITEKVRAAQALRESERALATLLSNLPGIAYRCRNDRQWTMEFISEGCLALTGYPPEDIVGNKKIAFADIIHPDDREQVWQKVQAALQAGEPYRLTYRILTADGQVKWVWEQGRGVDGGSGPAQVLEGFITDITDRVRAEEALRTTQELLRTVLEGVQDIIYKFDLRQGRLEYVSPAVQAVLGFTPDECSSLKGRDMIKRIHPDDRRRFAERLRPLLRGSSLEYEDRTAEFRLKHKDGHYVWIGDRSKTICDGAGRPIALVGTWRDISARKRAEEALGRALPEVHRILRGMAERVFVKDGSLRFVYVSKSFAEDAGTVPEAMIGKTDFDFYPPDRVRSFQAADRQVMESGRPLETETTWTDPSSGRQRKQRWLKLPIKDAEGHVAALVGIGSWAGERQEAEQLIAHSASLAMSSADAIIGLTAEGTVMSWNAGAEATYGYTAQEMRGRSVTVLVPREGRDEFLAHLKRVAEAAEPIRHLEAEHVTCDGRRIYVAMSIAPVLDREGKPMAASLVARDITEQKRSEQALARSERRYRLLASNVSDLIWTSDLNLRFTYVSPSVTRMLGYTPEELSHEDIGRVLTPASLQRAMDTLAEEIAAEEHQPLDTSRSRTLELELLRKDGQTLWTETRVTFLRDRGARPVGLMGVTRDISERKRAEAILRESEERFRSLFECATDLIFILDPDRRILHCNPEALQRSGYREEEMVGRQIEHFFTPASRELFEAQARILLPEAGMCRTEAEFVCKSGTVLTMDCSLSSIRDAQGCTSSLVAFLRDIGEHVQAREQLRMLSLVDELTGLNNRRGFTHLADQQMRIARRTNSPMLLLFADVDNMKWINDNLGHKEGDVALVEAANVLKETFRDADVIGRWGGDEFAVLALNADQASIEHVLARLQNRIMARNAQAGRRYELSLSVGVVSYDPAYPCSLDELIARADALMYADKRAHRQQWLRRRKEAGRLAGAPDRLPDGED